MIETLSPDLTRESRSHFSSGHASRWLLQRGVAAVACFVGLLMSLPAQADMEIPASTASNTGGGVFDLGCSDLLVAGTLSLDAGQIINVRHVNIQAGGVINGNAGLISLSGNWSNAGSFAAGASTVNFVDNTACAASATVSGNTAFNNVNFTSTTGKTYTFAAGTTQQVLGLLTVSGTSTVPIVFVSSTPGQFASINLSVGGAQSIRNLSADWMSATGVWLAVGQNNRNPNGRTSRLFGEGEVVPALDNTALAMLTLLMLFGGLWARRRTVLATRT